MRRTIEIIFSSFKMAMQELWKNKLRTFLSLFGVTIGIFCIIGVLATVNSLEHNIQNEIKSLGTNTIYVDRWDYTAGGGPDYPWWKYVNRPVPKFREVEQVKKRTTSAKFAAFMINVQDNAEVGDNVLSGVRLYGVTEEFNEIQPVDITYGRYISDIEFDQGINEFVIGTEIAEKLFGNVERALGKMVTIRGKKGNVAGIIKKQGNQIIGGWQFDQSIVMPYKFARNIMDEYRSDPLILVQGQDNLTSKALKDELRGTMRSVHKLSPTKDDDFALNDVNDFSDMMSSAFTSINIGGFIIAGFSLLVGLFGLANIMFVSVKERTNQIGIKKAIGAKSRVILSEFLLEATFLCIIGGMIGLTLVFVLTIIFSRLLNFPVYISTGNLVLALSICIGVGILAGIIPAYIAARMDPVAAIRS
jgi:putative ABC transport system permease protein